MKVAGQPSKLSNLSVLTIAYLGNSVTAQRDSYVEPLHALLQARWSFSDPPRKAALGGVGSLAVAGLLDYLVLRHRPNVCFVECSLADSAGATPLSMIALALRSIFSDLHAHSIAPIVLHLPRRDVSEVESDLVVNLYNEIAGEFGVTVIDVRALAREGRYRDDVHMTSELSLFTADCVAAQLSASAILANPSERRETHELIRMVPIKCGEMLTGHASESRFRHVFETLIFTTGSTFKINHANGYFVGLYVIANDESAVIEIGTPGFMQSIQVWDRWCERPRIQFIPLWLGSGNEGSIEVTVTDLEYASRTAHGDRTPDRHKGISLEVLGAAVAVPHAHGDRVDGANTGGDD